MNRRDIKSRLNNLGSIAISGAITATLIVPNPECRNIAETNVDDVTWWSQELLPLEWRDFSEIEGRIETDGNKAISFSDIRILPSPSHVESFKGRNPPVLLATVTGSYKLPNQLNSFTETIAYYHRKDVLNSLNEDWVDTRFQSNLP